MFAKHPRLKILLSIYACEPGKGSEPGVGWNWAIQLSEYCDVTVVTRANNQAAIEQETNKNSKAARIRWIYHDLSAPWLALKKRFKAHRLYYSTWQRTLIPKLWRLCASKPFDIVHHLTFASYRYRTAIAGLPGVKIWGPVGGAETIPWALMPWDHPGTLVHEITRSLQTWFAPGLDQTHHYTHIYASTSETRRLLSSKGFAAELLPTIGLGRDEIPQKNITHPENLRLLFVGSLQHLKGIHFAIKALPLIPDSIKLTIVGSGPYGNTLKNLVRKTDVTDRVTFLGKLPQEEVFRQIQQHDVFVFPSLHDSGGIALLEAMAAGLPSVVLACGGPGGITDSSCAFQIPVTDKKSIIQGIAHAINRYSEDAELYAMHGRNARSRVMQHFLWEDKAQKMALAYREILERANSPLSLRMR